MKYAHVNLALGLTLVMILSGCAQKTWYKENGTEAEFVSERYACERDVRQSGYFGGGIAGSINMANFFNECMNAKGWSLEDKKQLGAVEDAKKSVVALALDDLRMCKQSVRENSAFSSISSSFSDINTGQYNFAQTSDDRVPSAEEARLLQRYFTESDHCRKIYKEAIARVDDESTQQHLQKIIDTADSDASELVRRKISYGEFATRENRNN